MYSTYWEEIELQDKCEKNDISEKELINIYKLETYKTSKNGVA